jgi:hypothetical protein
VSTSGAAGNPGEANGPRHLSAAQLVAAKNIQPIRSADEMAANVFESDEELEEFLAFTYAERRRGMRPDAFRSGAASESDSDDRADDS